MPVTIKKSQLMYKNPSTGEYVSVDAVADKTSQQQINGINTAASNAIASINTAMQDIDTQPLTTLPKKAYKKDLVANEETLASAATHAYAVGDYFFVADNNNDISLYKATAAIAVGATISPGTGIDNNCVPAALADDVTSLSNDLDNNIVKSNILEENLNDLNINIYGECVIYPDWVNNSIKTATGELSAPSLIRATNESLIYVPDGYKLSYTLFDNAGVLKVSSYYYDNNKELITYKVSETQMSVSASYVRYYLYTSDNSNIDINMLNNIMIIKMTTLDCIKNDIENLQQNNIQITDGKNKYNEENNEIGYLMANGSISGGDTYFTTGYIDLQDFKYGISINKQARKILFYDITQIPISDSLKETTPAGVIELNNNYKYMRASFYYTTTNIMICDSSSIQDYEKYEIIAADGINFANKETLEHLNSGTSILNGKKWAVCGDSFTAGADTGTLQDGKYAGQKIVYPYIIGNIENMTILNFFQNGRTLAYPADGTFNNSLTAPTQTWYYQNIPEDVDYITIYLGINDLHHQNASAGSDGEDISGAITLGTIDDNTTATYYGAWNVVLSWLIENRPFAHIGIIVTNGANEDYMNAQINIANKYGIPYLNMNGDNRTPCMIRSSNPNIPANIKAKIQLKQAVDYPNGNTHPNNATHFYESTFITNFLKSL